MRITIFSQAIKLQKYLRETGTGHNTIYFEYEFKNDKNVLVELAIEENKTIVKCSCKHHSMHELALCQYTLGVFFYLFRKQMRQLKTKW